MRFATMLLLILAAQASTACPNAPVAERVRVPAGLALVGDEQPTLSQALANQERARCLQRRDPLAGYQKQTAFDNTPYRFNMKPGQKMNAADFDAWMKSRGIRIVPAKAESASTAAAAVAQ